jgi:hypothetical protein
LLQQVCGNAFFLITQINKRQKSFTEHDQNLYFHFFSVRNLFSNVNMCMNLPAISNLRLINQQVSSSKIRLARELVSWMGAIQAQDFNMAKWAVGIRIPNSTEDIIEQAIDNGEILRTHVLRPTWHFIAPENLGWMLQLTSERIKAAMRPSDKRLGITESIYDKSNSVIEGVLNSDDYLTRDELTRQLNLYGIDTLEFRISHLLMRAELDGIICSGKFKNGNPTYTLVSKHVKPTEILNREGALSKLATLYFSSHGPATLFDFAWWSGLSVGEAREAIEIIKPNLISEIAEGNTYLYLPSIFQEITEDSFFLLPAFDEFIISYRDRTPSLPVTHFSRAVSSNGIFRPIIVSNGQTIGIWNRIKKNNRIEVKATYFQAPSPKIKDNFEKAVLRLSDFWSKPVILIDN